MKLPQGMVAQGMVAQWMVAQRTVAWIMVLALALGLTTALAACGKKGPPDPPGPADQITYPRSYPTR